MGGGRGAQGFRVSAPTAASTTAAEPSATTSMTNTANTPSGAFPRGGGGKIRCHRNCRSAVTSMASGVAARSPTFDGLDWLVSSDASALER